MSVTDCQGTCEMAELVFLAQFSTPTLAQTFRETQSWVPNQTQLHAMLQPPVTAGRGWQHSRDLLLPQWPCDARPPRHWQTPQQRVLKHHLQTLIPFSSHNYSFLNLPFKNIIKAQIKKLVFSPSEHHQMYKLNNLPSFHWYFRHFNNCPFVFLCLILTTALKESKALTIDYQSKAAHPHGAQTDSTQETDRSYYPHLSRQKHTLQRLSLDNYWL